MISVIIPAYNAEKFIGETLASILAQSFQNFEIIVVDDGSTDNTVQLVNRFRQADERIRLVLNNHGHQSKARNTGIALAKYDWIAPIDADDVMLPTRFEEQIKAAEANPQVVAWGSYSMLITSNGSAYRERRDRPTTQAEFEKLMAEGQLILMPNSSCLLRKDIINKVGGYDSRFDSLEDVELLLRMSQHGPILVLPKILMQYRMHYSSTTGAFDSFRWQRKLFIFLEERNAKRLRGEDLELDEFLEQYDAVPVWRRALRYIDNLSAFQLKMAALYYGEKRNPQLITAMLASFLLNPFYIAHRVINRIILKREFNNYRV